MIRQSKSTWSDGLIMDFAPDNTSSSCLTSALNATILTYNGNEMCLQNDMGNGRVETAFLPEGYVPVGTCEFGDIIYIVSYNPLTNKSQIGCFPSPERNISSCETGDLKQSLKSSDFQVLGEDNKPTGELVASSVKKILYGTRDMTSGDKYIIYSSELDNNNKHLSDYRNTSHQHGKFPKLVKIHVVSIEESGKIVYLDSTTKWYKENDFYIQNSKKIDETQDLDNYRTMVSSAYSIFSSKVSGKLALLVELEKINSFSCTWSAHTSEMEEQNGFKKNRYSIYWNFNWGTDDNNINPSAVVLTESKWTGENEKDAGKYFTWKPKLKDPEEEAVGDNIEGWILSEENIYYWEENEDPQKNKKTPVAFPEEDYKYSKITRVYQPESYEENFQEFINSGSYEAQSISILNEIKGTLNIPNAELTKVNIAKNGGVPDEGWYYFNCYSSTIKDGEPTYYTSYENQLVKISAQEVSDDIINNTFSYPIIKKFVDFDIITQQKIQKTEKNEEGETKVISEEWKDININNLIYYYELTPAMPYGLLREFSQNGYIDFKKIGTKSINLNSWKYYNYENTSTLTWGLEAYTEPNKGISEVVFEFYDNNGVAAVYHNTGKESYNGKFTEYFTLNSSGTNYKLNNIGLDGEPFYHKGIEVTKDQAVQGNIYLDKDGNPISIKEMVDGGEYFLDDAGTLYSNCLYLVKITVKYCNIGALGEYLEDSYIEDYRWYWTNAMFNDYYYSTPDFKELQFTLDFDLNHIYKQKDSFTTNTVNYLANSTSENDYEQLSSNVEYVNQDRAADQEGNISIKIQAGLQNDYLTFNLDKVALEGIKVRTYLGKSYISQSEEQPEIIYQNQQIVPFSGIYPINETEIDRSSGYIDSKKDNIGSKLMSLLGLSGGQSNKELFSSEDSYKNYTNSFSLNFAGKEEVYQDSPIEYINNQEENSVSLSTDMVEKTLNFIELSANESIDLTFTGIVFSKFYNKIKQTDITCKVLKPLLRSQEDLDKYNLFVHDNHLYFKNIGGLAVGNDGDGDHRFRVFYYKSQANSDGAIVDKFQYLGHYKGGKRAISFFEYGLQYINGDSLVDIYSGMVPFFIMRSDDFGKCYRICRGIDNSNNPLITGSIEYNKCFTANSSYCGGFHPDFSGLSNTNSYIVLGIKDISGNLHLTNSFIPVVYSTISKTIFQKPSYKKDYDQEKQQKTIGDMLGSVLMNLYSTNNISETVSYPKIVNFVKLKGYDILFTRDIISEVTVSSDTVNQNSLLLMRGMEYQKYLSKLNEYIKGEINNSNVNVKINGIVKNTPLSLLFKYKPEEYQEEVTPSFAILCSDGTTLFKNITFNSERLYSRNIGTEDFLSVSSLFQYNPISKVNYEGDSYIAEFNTSITFSNSYISQNFTLKDGQLVCSNDSKTIPEQDCFTINGKEENYSGLFPINIRESLIPNAKYG